MGIGTMNTTYNAEMNDRAGKEILGRTMFITSVMRGGAVRNKRNTRKFRNK